MKKLYLLLIVVLLLMACANFQTTNSVELKGQLLPGAMIVGQAPLGSKIFFNDRALKQTQQVERTHS